MISVHSFSLEFQIPEKSDQDYFDGWLSLLLDKPVQVIAQQNPNEESTSLQGQTWLSGILKFSTGLFQILGIPVFRGIKITACEELNFSTMNSWRGTCFAPDLKSLPRDLVARVLLKSVSLAAWAGQADFESKENQLEFQRKILEDPIFSPLGLGHKPKSPIFYILGVAHPRIPYLDLQAGLYQLGWGIKSRRIERSTTDSDSAMGMKWSGDKRLTSSLLNSAGLPVPRNFEAKTISEAKRFARQLGFPVVVKPVDAERGEGVGVDVFEEGLEDALREALKWSRKKIALVERQISGTAHRVWICKGKLLYAISRLPFGVYADGKSSIAELIEIVNSTNDSLPPWKRDVVQKLDEESKRVLRLQGYTGLSIPAKGRFIPLRRIETTAMGGIKQDVTATIHPDNVRIAARAADLLGLEVAGVDIISQDITVPWHKNNAKINEVNYAPALGNNDISRAYIPEYLSLIIDGDGRIPIEVFVGGQSALGAAQIRQLDFLASGIKAWITSRSKTLSPPRVSPEQLFLDEKLEGEICNLAITGLANRAKALLMSRETEALILVVEDDEISETLALIDRVDAVRRVDDELVTPSSEENKPLSVERKEALWQKLGDWTLDSA